MDDEDGEKKISDDYFKELIMKQIKGVVKEKRLQFSDLKRITKYINGSIFDENNCCIWTGYITNSKNKNKGTYINFYFRKKKVALHRLLYINFVEKLNSDEYLKFSCNNKGKCCNIHHMNKFKYNKYDDDSKSDDLEKQIEIDEKLKPLKKVDTLYNCDKLRISFD